MAMGNLLSGSPEVTYVFLKSIISPVLQTYLLLPHDTLQASTISKLWPSAGILRLTWFLPVFTV